MGTAGLGQGAAASEAGIGASTGNTMAQLMASIGSSQAAGTVGSANAINSGLTGATNSITQTMLLNQLLNGSSVSSGTLNSLINQQNNAFNTLEGQALDNTFGAGNG